MFLFKRRSADKPNQKASPSSKKDLYTKAEATLDRHFSIQAEIEKHYRTREQKPGALDAAIRACEKQIAMAEETRWAFQILPLWADQPLPRHIGFEQLAIIREKQGKYEEAIYLCRTALEQGWSGNWEARIQRCETKLKKPEKYKKEFAGGPPIKEPPRPNTPAKVPVFKKYYSTTADLSPTQRTYYEHWKNAWNSGTTLDIEGQVSYVFCYLHEVLARIFEGNKSGRLTIGTRGLIVKNRRVAYKMETQSVREELDRIGQAYQHENVLYFYCRYWISDCWVIEGNLKEGVVAFPNPPLESRSSTQTDHLLSLKVATKQRLSGRDVLTLAGPKVTAFGRKHLDEIAQYLDVLVEARHRHEKCDLLEQWKRSSECYSFTAFSGSRYATQLPEDYLPVYAFSNNAEVLKFVAEFTREAENTIRSEAGIPRVGEGWVAETELYYTLKDALSPLDVIHHASPEWLGRQHLDIFIPELNTAIEYQGLQHDQPVEYFGGEEGFEETQRRDAKKRRICEREGIRLLYVRPGYELDEVVSDIRSN